MISLNDLLHLEDIDPASVKLARHQDRRIKAASLYTVWRSDQPRFEAYQKIQHRPVFDDAKWIASFVVTPADETLFVGLFAVGAKGIVPQGTKDPVGGHDVSGLNLYDLAAAKPLSAYIGKLVIDWGLGYRSWVQWAAKQNKVVIELRKQRQEPPFPGLLDFRENLSALPKLPQSWRSVLASVSGVYLLVHPTSGKQYVGSAHGGEGFWGRWMDYVASGHGGNKRMADIPAADYQVSILEITSPLAGTEELFRLENRWKEKLRTREFGLTGN